jgi:hypothetical protein
MGSTMKAISSIFLGLAILGLNQTGAQTTEPASPMSDGPIFKNLSDLKWDKIIPNLGENSPEICFLRVDPQTHASSLLVRTSKAIHVRKHWHTANESHTMFPERLCWHAKANAPS